DSADVDEFMWNHPQMLVTTSAGNAGRDGNSNGIVDLDSMGAPGTSKNVLTVGASENARSDNYPCDTGASGIPCSGSNVIGTYYQSWPSKFPANPLKDDPSAGNEHQMAGFSSRGPTDDGRIKPDVVAPGTWVLSGYSALYQQEYGDPFNPQNGLPQYDGWGYPYSETYKYMGGTSMSNPLVAGGAAVVRDYYQKAHSHSASAALVKATLINSAVDLLDENNDGANDNDYPIPNMHEGWGRVDLAAATDGNRQFVDEASGVSGGSSKQYQFDVAGGQPLKVTLAWSDYPSSMSASVNLVNNLNLVVTGPGGSPVYKGNVFNGGWSQTGGTADSLNNIENVYVQNPTAGTWTVEVSGANVPIGPQPFALVVDVAQPAALDIPLSTGWNMISSYVNPSDPALETLLAGIQANMVLIKDINGNIYWPEFGSNTIGDWDVRQGYKIYMNAPATLTITGQAVNRAQTAISLPAGWSMIAFLSDTPMAIDQALASISGQLVLAKNGGGDVYWPAFNVNQVGDMQPGQGYKLYLQSPGTLIYP
ncbi:MAG: S8 family serine peptidase, partial [Candidatus Promineifilaceae bacterium]